ncbi:hypothetical protein FQA39_LY05487 [Lamprigera yunnana]|nr:hypothetical protein FQA39_LY05487 [Lamprigera yunnana]
MIGSEIDAPRSENDGQASKATSVKIRANKNLDEGEDDVSDSSVDMVLESEEEADWPQVEEDESTLEELNSHYEVNNFIVVKLEAAGHNKFVYYVAKVLCKLEDGPEVSFLRKSEKVSGAFVFPIVPDLSFIENENVKMTLPKPTLFGQTKRQQSHFKFEIRFNNLDIQ